eukprot:symbB.v1.2.016141.t1/scaffold1167.1/size134246/1
MANVCRCPDGRAEDYSKKEVKGYGKGKETKGVSKIQKKEETKGDEAGSAMDGEKRSEGGSDAEVMRGLLEERNKMLKGLSTKPAESDRLELMQKQLDELLDSGTTNPLRGRTAKDDMSKLQDVWVTLATGARVPMKITKSGVMVSEDEMVEPIEAHPVLRDLPEHLKTSLKETPSEDLHGLPDCNRRRRKLLNEGFVVYLYAGEKEGYWLGRAVKEVGGDPRKLVEVDILRDRDGEGHHDMMKKDGVYSTLLRAALDGKILGVITSPNCRSRSVLKHYPLPGGFPRPIRSWKEPWGKSDLTQDEKKVVREDDTLMWKSLMVYMVSFEMRKLFPGRSGNCEVKLGLEQPADPSHYMPEAKFMLVGAFTALRSRSGGEKVEVSEEVEAGPEMEIQEDEIEEGREVPEVRLEAAEVEGVEEDWEMVGCEEEVVEVEDEENKKVEERQDPEIETLKLGVPLTGKTKEEVLSGIIDLYLKLRMDGYMVHTIHTDQEGREFVNRDSKSWMRSRGIIHSTNSGEDPKANGRAERSSEARVGGRSSLDRISGTDKDEMREMVTEIDLWDEAIKSEMRSLLEEKKALKLLTSEEREEIVARGNFIPKKEEEDLFASGSDAVGMRVALKKAATELWTGASINIKTAFLNAPLPGGEGENEEDLGTTVILRPPPLLVKLGYVKAGDSSMALKAIYNTLKNPLEVMEGSPAVLWGGSLIMWKSGRQPLAPLSTAESELQERIEGMTMGDSRDVLIMEVEKDPYVRTLKMDNMAAVNLIADPSGSWRTRHLPLRASHFRWRIGKLDWMIEAIPGEVQVADIGTKALSAPRLEELKKRMGMGCWKIAEEHPEEEEGGDQKNQKHQKDRRVEGEKEAMDESRGARKSAEVHRHRGFNFSRMSTRRSGGRER